MLIVAEIIPDLFPAPSQEGYTVSITTRLLNPPLSSSESRREETSDIGHINVGCHGGHGVTPCERADFLPLKQCFVASNKQGTKHLHTFGMPRYYPYDDRAQWDPSDFGA